MTSQRAISGEVVDPKLPRKASKWVWSLPVLETDSGGWVENTKALERTVVKELNTLPP